MKQFQLILLFISLCFGDISSFAQIDDSKKIKDIKEKIADNRNLLITDTEKVFENIDELMDEAIEMGYKEGELILLSNRCWYYSRRDLNKGIKASEQLKLKAKSYGNPYYEAVSYEYLSYIYSLSELPDNAIDEFRKGIKILNKLDNNQTNEDIIHTKANLYTSAGLAYIQKNDSHQNIKMLRNANKEISRLPESENKRLLLYINYSNLGGSYADINLDSSEYFINHSVSLKKPEEEIGGTQFYNYLILGYIHRQKGDYTKSFEYYKKSEYQIPLVRPTYENTRLVYEGLADIYEKMDSLEQHTIYLQKLNRIELEHEKSKNQSLHTIIDNEMIKDKTTVIYVAVGLSIIIVLLIVLLFYFKKRNAILAKQEKQSQEYLVTARKLENINTKEYSDLVEIANKRDPAFLAMFSEVYPDFIEKLQKINPKIVHTELEFCALMKLNLATKEIAKILSIEPKSVRARKYRIRKKLNIEDDVEIYFWFSQL